MTSRHGLHTTLMAVAQMVRLRYVCFEKPHVHQYTAFFLSSQALKFIIWGQPYRSIQFIEDSFHIHRLETAVDFLAYHHHRRQAACSDTPETVQ